MQSPVGWNDYVALRALQGLRRTLGRILRGFTRAGESLRDTSATVCTTAWQTANLTPVVVICYGPEERKKGKLNPLKKKNIP